MKKVKITAIRKVQYDDLMAKYENPIEHEHFEEDKLMAFELGKTIIN